MFKRIAYIVLFLLLAVSCSRIMEPEAPQGTNVPNGLPITLYIPFGSTEMLDVDVQTKAEAAGADETRVHDLYVMIFSNRDKVDDAERELYDSPRKVYGRYFSYEHINTDLDALNADPNESWYVKNKNLSGSIAETTGAVKISTETCDDAILVVIANVSNSVTNLDGEDALDRLNAVRHLKELQSIEVRLEQDVVNRKDLFLMTGSLGKEGDPENPGSRDVFNTANFRWNKEEPNETEYNETYHVDLTPIDAKVKFRVEVDTYNISDVRPVYWQVFNTPDRCYLDSSWEDEAPPTSTRYFDSQQYYFEGTEKDGDHTYYTFCFYILENRFAATKNATKYYQREKQKKTDTQEGGYGGPSDPNLGDHFVSNGDWEYAPANAAYVKFDMVLQLTTEGLQSYRDVDPSITINKALTSDAIFTVHLGNFSSSGKPDGYDGFNDYRTERGNFYTYNIKVINTSSIFAEVHSDDERQAGQEGYLLLTDAEIINADCHYEYHQIEFKYRPGMTQDKFSWYVKTPFGDGGPAINPHNLGGGKFSYDYYADGEIYYLDGDTEHANPKTAPKLDYKWAMFGVNKIEDGIYTTKRHKYPGIGRYDKNWHPGKPVGENIPHEDPDRPDLMDITQLIEYIFAETEKETAHEENDFISDDGVKTPVIRVTAFIDEYYYEKHPLENPETAKADPSLWRQFINAAPREMHILSDAQSSRDRASDLILSSHSIIQQSIQTIYNTHATSLTTLWGTEHMDEMRQKYGALDPVNDQGWPYWPGSTGTTESGNRRSGNYNKAEGRWNGRLNSGYIWDFCTSAGAERTGQLWETYLKYDVDNSIPEMRGDGGEAPKTPYNDTYSYEGMAFSCLSRNRDNNGDGVVDRNEVRWYLAACNQLAGLWIGNESLSINARLYQPAKNQWRAHIISSTGQRVSWAEEGGGATEYSWDYLYDSRYVWHSIEEAAKGQSVRCLRNIGTFNDGGTIKDISEAPYTQEIDPYFDLTDNGDGSYTFTFDRLNPKSLRELSEGELPYHDQFSVNNCVYLEFDTQRLSDNVGEKESDAFSIKLENINNEVTKLGRNPYCPPGYRFPNQSEMLLMTLYLPLSYFTTDYNNGGSYSNTALPTRTYYDRGWFRDQTRDYSAMSDADKTKEFNKVGWCFRGEKQSNLAKGTDIAHSRCVKDNSSMHGFIDGGILMESDDVCPGDPVPLTFSFFSSGAAFVSALLELCYTDGDGSYHADAITVAEPPTGLQYLSTQTVNIPSLAAMGLSVEDLDTDKKNLKFRITLRNALMSKTFEHNITLASHLTDCSVSLPGVADPDKGMPIHVNIGNRNGKSKIHDITVHYKASSDGNWNTHELVAHDHDYTWSGDVYLRDIIGEDAWATEANRYKEYQFYVTASSNDGTTYVSETLSQELVRLNYTPNPAPEGGWTSSNSVSDINTTWKDKIENLYFANGDYIETLMDLTNCYYVYKNGNKNVDIGLDNILGLSSIENLNPNPPSHAMLIYYPAIPTLDPDPAKQGDPWLKMSAGKWSSGTAGKIPGCDNISSLLFVFDKDGFSTNGARYTGNVDGWSGVKTELTGCDALWIGSEEGVHHSRAIYKYIRVVRNVGDAVTPIPRP